jgi:hypothetical protein
MKCIRLKEMSVFDKEMIVFNNELYTVERMTVEGMLIIRIVVIGIVVIGKLNA